MLIKFVPAAFLFVVINRLLFTFVGVIYRGFSVNDSFDKLLGLFKSVFHLTLGAVHIAVAAEVDKRVLAQIGL